MICNFTDGITYGPHVDDMLNRIKRITNRMKLLIFFGTHGLFVKPSINLLMTNSPIDQKLPMNIFSTDVFCHTY